MDLHNNYIEFLNNDLFIFWRTNPTDELNTYWSDYIDRNKDKSDSFNKAIEEFEKIRQQIDSSSEIDLSTLDLIHSKVNERNKQLKYKRNFLIFKYSAASIFIIALITALYIFNNENINDDDLTTIGKVTDANSVLLSSGGKTVEINNNSTIFVSEKENSTIISEEGEVKVSHTIDIENNTLIVPYGKRISIVLSDGSTVHLNSGTKMEFPARFSGTKRRIHVEGEVFVDVTKNDKKPFIVSTPLSQITVFGTSFNVSSYEEDLEESVVLVSGKVQVENKNKSLILNPNEIAKITNEQIVRNKVNVSEYISWKSGYMELNNEPLKSVLRKISRYYNIEFNYNSELDIYARTCSGKLYLSDDLTDVLEAFSKMTFLTYEKNGNNITIFE